ncbi:MAG: hypothetical protein SVY10_08335 [Thermodesulfobacteriota bacterium]|nr:hypothetical protein [Thermodesulfobacteriota bacterium]
MVYSYKVFGQFITSNVELPQISPIDNDSPNFISVCFKRDIFFDHVKFNNSQKIFIIPQQNLGIPAFEIIKVEGSKIINYILHYCYNKQEAYFTIDNTLNNIDIYWSDTVKFDELLPILFGSVMGCLLRLKNIFSLHGSTVAKDDEAITIIGNSGSGKSTLTAYLLSKGFSLVSDDLTVFASKRSPSVFTGFPCIRMNSDTKDFCSNQYRSFYWRSKGNKVDKNYYEASDFYYNNQIVVQAFYFLDSFNNTNERTVITELKSSQKILILLQNSYANYILSAEQKKSEFQFVKDLLPIPLYSIVQPKSFECLEHTYTQILANQ